MQSTGTIALTMILISVGTITTRTAIAATDERAQVAVTTSEQGLKISIPGMEAFNLSYPIIEGERISGCVADKSTATVTYDEGTKITVRIAPNGTVTYHLTGLPPTVKRVELQLPLSPDYAKGGVYRVNDADAIPFPEAPPADPQFLKHNQSNRLSIHDAAQRNLVLHLPGHSYLQIEDWRNKPTPVFMVRIISPIMSPDVTLHVGDPPATRSAANQPPITIPSTNKPVSIDGATEKWKAIPSHSLSATREVGGQDKSTLHAPSWAIPTSLEGKAADVSATFRVCWDKDNLYLLVDVSDSTPLHNPNASDHLWAGDAIELFIGTEALTQSGDLLGSDRQVILGADAILGSRTHVRGVEDQPTFPAIAVARPGGYLIETAIPLSVLGLTPNPGTKFRFDLGLDDSVDGKGRHAQLMWNGTNQNSNERTDWGWATLGK